jgi:hypothetical protein
MAVLIWATPLLKGTALPKSAPSIWNCTTPGGVPGAELTVAVKVTDWP